MKQKNSFNDSASINTIKYWAFVNKMGYFYSFEKFENYCCICKILNICMYKHVTNYTWIAIIQWKEFCNIWKWIK